MLFAAWAYLLARRWNLDVARIQSDGSGADGDFDAVIFRDRSLDPRIVAGLLRTGTACWHLGEAESEAEPEIGGAVSWLRAPLVESRLIGALIDRRLAGRRPSDEAREGRSADGRFSPPRAG